VLVDSPIFTGGLNSEQEYPRSWIRSLTCGGMVRGGWSEWAHHHVGGGMTTPLAATALARHGRLCGIRCGGFSPAWDATIHKHHISTRVYSGALRDMNAVRAWGGSSHGYFCRHPRLDAGYAQARLEARAEQVIRDYEDMALRVSYCYAGTADQNRPVYEAERCALFAEPAEELQGPTKRWFERVQDGLDERAIGMSKRCTPATIKPQVKIQLAPGT